MISTTDLGCANTYKLSFDVKHPDRKSPLFSEIHFVDSARFIQVGKTFGEWADYVASLGADQFTVYMHNKLQFYVPDVAPLYRKLQADGVPAFYHLSKSNGSETYDVAHVGITIDEAVTTYEIVSAITNLTATELESFSPWSDVECGPANNIKNTLSYYQKLYDNMASTDREVAWFASTGLYVPMAIAIFTPVSSLDYVASHVEGGALITGGVMNTDVISDTCSMMTVNMQRDDEDPTIGFNPLIKYIANTAAYQGEYLNLSKWEGEVETTHTETITTFDSSGFSSWNRYLQ